MQLGDDAAIGCQQLAWTHRASGQTRPRLVRGQLQSAVAPSRLEQWMEASGMR